MDAPTSKVPGQGAAKALARGGGGGLSEAQHQPLVQLHSNIIGGCMVFQNTVIKILRVQHHMCLVFLLVFDSSQFLLPGVTSVVKEASATRILLSLSQALRRPPLRVRHHNHDPA